jgi:FtsH-binding integral membrane protein
MKALAVLCAVVNLGAVGVVAWFLWFLVAFPWENTTPEGEAAEDGLVAAAVLLAASAVALLVGVAASRRSWAAFGLILQTVVVVALLALTFSEDDDYAGRVLGVAVGIELVAIASVWLLRAHLESRRLMRH